MVSKSFNNESKRSEEIIHKNAVTVTEDTNTYQNKSKESYKCGNHHQNSHNFLFCEKVSGLHRSLKYLTVLKALGT